MAEALSILGEPKGDEGAEELAMLDALLSDR